MTPSYVHTPSKPFSGVCHDFYQDITGIVSAIFLLDVLAFNSVDPWLVHISLRLIETIKNHKGLNREIKNT